MKLETMKQDYIQYFKFSVQNATRHRLRGEIDTAMRWDAIVDSYLARPEHGYSAEELQAAETDIRETLSNSYRAEEKAAMSKFDVVGKEILYCVTIHDTRTLNSQLVFESNNPDEALVVTDRLEIILAGNNQFQVEFRRTERPIERWQVEGDE